MFDAITAFLAGGLTQASWLQVLVFLLIATHITIVAITVYLHRCQAHRGLDLHPIISHFFRFWLWATTGMMTKEWVAVHRKHHATCETPDDPHSPKHYGIGTVLLHGTELYRDAIVKDTLERFGHGTPDDWMERNVYSRYHRGGIFLSLAIAVLLFGTMGFTVWAVQMIWTPFWAAGMINGMAHWAGYRTFETPDTSTNITPIAFWIGGEELHNNHHAFPSSAKFSNKWWEFDIGWMYIKILSFFGLAKVKRRMPKVHIIAEKNAIDSETIRSVILNRVHVMADYARNVVKPMVKSVQESLTLDKLSSHKIKKLMTREPVMMDEKSVDTLNGVLTESPTLKTIYNFRIGLQQIWDRAATSQDALLHALKEWCSQAEATGIQALQDFARTLRGYGLIPTTPVKT